MITHEWIPDPNINAVKFFLKNGNLQKIVLDRDEGQDRYIILLIDEIIIATNFDNKTELKFTSCEDFFNWIQTYKRCHLIVKLF